MALGFEKRNRVAVVTLNRPEAHNAVDPETVIELSAAWKEIRKDRDIRCAILTGAGEKTFCSGADLGRLIPLVTGAREPETEADKKIKENPTLTFQAFLRGVSIDKPIVAAINGDAIAGGMEILYSTDIRVAAAGSRFGLQEVKWSIFPMMGSSVHLPRQVPHARAMEMLLTGELVSAEQMHAWGFLNQVVDREKVMEQAERYASILAKNGPLALAALKKAVRETIGMGLQKALEKEMEIAIPVFMSKDAREGPRAFKEKREPEYKGE
ncbi:MAG: enoyl-CoA hydratase/isomerase family protein [Deltaproteobacteria bacterium]|nr:enoyl-CoA hydratase/isomerase family protein [Deltaproteobacteria bacterium]